MFHFTTFASQSVNLEAWQAAGAGVKEMGKVWEGGGGGYKVNGALRFVLSGVAMLVSGAWQG